MSVLTDGVLATVWSDPEWRFLDLVRMADVLNNARSDRASSLDIEFNYSGL